MIHTDTGIKRDWDSQNLRNTDTGPYTLQDTQKLGYTAIWINRDTGRFRHWGYMSHCLSLGYTELGHTDIEIYTHEDTQPLECTDTGT